VQICVIKLTEFFYFASLLVDQAGDNDDNDDDAVQSGRACAADTDPSRFYLRR
jgi:hypothetical protein